MATTITECVGRQAAIDAIFETMGCTEDELRTLDRHCALDRHCVSAWKNGYAHGLLNAIFIIRGMDTMATVFRYDTDQDSLWPGSERTGDTN